MGFAALTTAAALLSFGGDATTITASMKRGLLRFMGQQGMATSADTERAVDALVWIAPGLAAIGALMNLTINLWLAGRITATSGRLHRPWPDLKGTAMPPMTLVVLCVAIALCFTSGLVAMSAQIASAALLMAYALTGFAVLHTVTLALKARALWLTCTYIITVMFVWPVLILMVMVGLADAVFGLRERFLRMRPPPLPAP